MFGNKYKLNCPYKDLFSLLMIEYKIFSCILFKSAKQSSSIKALSFIKSYKSLISGNYFIFSSEKVQ